MIESRTGGNMSASGGGNTSESGDEISELEFGDMILGPTSGVSNLLSCVSNLFLGSMSAESNLLLEIKM